MICQNCGSNVDEGVYCPVCGAQVEEADGIGSEETTLLEAMPVTRAPDVATDKKVDGKKKKKKVLTPEERAQRKKTITKLIVAGGFFFFALNMISIAIIVGVLAINNPAYKVIDALEGGYYYNASSIYEGDMHSKPNKKLIEKLDKRLDDIWEDFQSQDMTYDSASEELGVIRLMAIEELSEKLDKITIDVEALNISRNAFKNGQKNAEWGYYGEAIYYYGLVVSTDPNYETAQSEIKKITALYKDDLFESVDNDIEYGYYSSAFSQLVEVKKALPKDTEIAEKITECEGLVVDEADKLIAEKKYDDAIELINGALEGYPESKTLAEKKAAIENGRPTFLKDLTASLDSKNYKYEDWEFTDANDVVHSDKFMFDPGLDDKKTANAEFYLEKKYTKFNATFVPNETTNEKEKFTIEILVDGKAVKTIKNFTLKSKNEAVEIDVTGASKLEIRVKSTDWNYYNYISMADACVYK